MPICRVCLHTQYADFDVVSTARNSSLLLDSLAVFTALLTANKSAFIVQEQAGHACPLSSWLVNESNVHSVAILVNFRGILSPLFCYFVFHDGVVPSFTLLSFFSNLVTTLLFTLFFGLLLILLNL